MKRNFSKSHNGLSDAGGLSVSICGSYNKHLAEIAECIEESKNLGMRVLIPKYAEKVRSTNGFCILRGERGEPRDLQDNNFESISMSDFMLVVDPNGYVGPSTSLEIGYAISKGVPVYCTERPTQYIFRLYTSWGKSLKEIKEILSGSETLELPPEIPVRNNRSNSKGRRA